MQSPLSLRLTCHGGRRGWGEERFKLIWIIDASAMSEVLRFMCTSTLCLGPESYDRIGGVTLPSSRWSWEKPEFYVLPPFWLDASKFSGAAGSDAGAGGRGSQAPPLLSPWLCLLYVFWFTHLWGTDVCNSPASWSVGQKHLGWVICDLLAVDWRGKKNINAGVNPPQLSLFMGICF